MFFRIFAVLGLPLLASTEARRRAEAVLIRSAGSLADPDALRAVRAIEVF